MLLEVDVQPRSRARLTKQSSPPWSSQQDHARFRATAAAVPVVRVYMVVLLLGRGHGAGWLTGEWLASRVALLP